MEKIIRLTESDLKRVIKKILNEQGRTTTQVSGAPVGGTTPRPKKPLPPSISTPIAPQLKGKKIDLYHDRNNTKLYAQVMISDISNYNGNAIIYLGINKEQGYMSFRCQDNQGSTIAHSFTYNHPSNKKFRVFNQKFSDELKKLMCVKNNNGIYVPKADYTSISPQTKNDYIA